MSFDYTTTHSSGEVLTGRLWRKDHLNDIPFHSNIPRMDDIEGPLLGTMGEDGKEGCALLLVSCLAISG
jgi:hypothetical protein